MLLNLQCMKSVFLFCHEWGGKFGHFCPYSKKLGQQQACSQPIRVKN